MRGDDVDRHPSREVGARRDDRGALGRHGRRPVDVSTAGPIRRPRRRRSSCSGSRSSHLNRRSCCCTSMDHQVSARRACSRSTPGSRPTPARRWFVWTGATSSRRRRRCCRSSATCSSCRRGTTPAPDRPAVVGWWSCSTPMSGWRRWMTGSAPCCCRSLPAHAVTVFAGREPPGPAWRADPAWRELLRVVSLRNLSPEDSRQYLHGCGVEPARHDQLIELAHGHPLGLSLLADVVVRGGEAAADPLTPDLVGTLLRRFVEVVPSGLHRRALEVCAIARVTTEGLLREVLGVEDAHDPFSWLRGLVVRGIGARWCVPARPGPRRPRSRSALARPRQLPARVPGDPRPHQRSTADVAGPGATAGDRRRQVHVPPTPRGGLAARLGRLGPAVPRARGAERPGSDPRPGPGRRGRGVGGDRGAMVGAATGGLLRGPQP